MKKQVKKIKVGNSHVLITVPREKEAEIAERAAQHALNNPEVKGYAKRMQGLSGVASNILKQKKRKKRRTLGYAQAN